MDIDINAERARSDAIHRLEIYNRPCGLRAHLILQLREALKTDEVLPPFWACIQLCDIDRLRVLVETSREDPARVLLLSELCASIALKWTQKTPEGLSSSNSESSTSIATSCPANPSTLFKLAIERDNNSCILTKGSQFQVSHIYPYYLINPQQRMLLEQSILEFWNLLQIFWEPERVSRWRADLFRDPQDATKAFDGCFNVLCLRDDLRNRWAKGHFALRPVFMSEDKKELIVELYWQPKASHTFRDKVDILKIPASSEGLDGYENNRLPIDVDGSPVYMKSGHSFTFTTHDPVTHHPPQSFALLEMQWHLTRIVSMSAAADVYDEAKYYNDDDDDAPDPAEAHPTSRTEILRWVQSTASSSSSADDDDNNNDDPHPSIPTSADVSPLKTRDTRGNSESAQTENVL